MFFLFETLVERSTLLTIHIRHFLFSLFFSFFFAIHLVYRSGNYLNRQLLAVYYITVCSSCLVRNQQPEICTVSCNTYVDPLKQQRNVPCTQQRNARAKSEMQGAWQTKQTRRVATTAIIREMQRGRERLAEDIEALALSNDRAHLRAGNGPTATRSALDSQWRGVCRSVKTLMGAGICAYKSYSPAKILPPDAASYCATAGPISVNFGPGPPIRRRFIDAPSFLASFFFFFLYDAGAIVTFCVDRST